jgi:hypothetical protein
VIATWTAGGTPAGSTSPQCHGNQVSFRRPTARSSSTTGEEGAQNIRRVIRTKPSLYYEAGDRTGRLPETIDLDFKQFLEAFTAAVTPLKSPAQAKPAAAAVK